MAEDGRQTTVEQKAEGGTPEPRLGGLFLSPASCSSSSEPEHDDATSPPTTDQDDRDIVDFPIGIDDAIGTTRDDGRSQPEAVRDQADEYRRSGMVDDDEAAATHHPPERRPRVSIPRTPEQRAAELEERREFIRAQGRKLLAELPTES